MKSVLWGDAEAVGSGFGMGHLRAQISVTGPTKKEK